MRTFYKFCFIINGTLLYDLLFLFEADCDVDCVTAKTKKKMRKTINRLKYAINRENLVVTFNENTEYQVTRRSFRTTSEVETACQPGHLMVNNKCGE